MALLLFSNTQGYLQRVPEITVKPSRFLDPYGTLFKSFDYYCASRRKLAHYSCIPNTFPALKEPLLFSGKIRTFLRPVFTCPPAPA